MEKVIKKHFRTLAIQTRYKYNFSQSEMAEALQMSVRAYQDIENGTNTCGTLTAILLLISAESPENDLQILKNELQRISEVVTT